MTERKGFVTILALFFLLLLSAVLIFQLQSYRRQAQFYDTLISHYQSQLKNEKEVDPR